MKNHITQIAVTSVAILLGPLFVYAWTAPISTPPNNNVSSPLNSGGTAQSKVGGLLVNSGNNNAGLIVYGSSATVGKVGIGDIANPSYKLQVGLASDGSTVGATSFLYFSDARLKKNVVTLPDALSKILKLRGVSFDWIDSDKSDIGLIAQEVEQIYPQAVFTGNDGIKSVDYGHLVSPLIEAVKAQQKEIDTLKARIAALETRK